MYYGLEFCKPLASLPFAVRHGTRSRASVSGVGFCNVWVCSPSGGRPCLRRRGLALPGACVAPPRSRGACMCGHLYPGACEAGSVILFRASVGCRSAAGCDACAAGMLWAVLMHRARSDRTTIVLSVYFSRVVPQQVLMTTQHGLRMLLRRGGLLRDMSLRWSGRPPRWERAEQEPLVECMV